MDMLAYYLSKIKGKANNIGKAVILFEKQTKQHSELVITLFRN